ncbi:hypothetical protein PV326_006467 [Microctonus aethiopoides]|nr:hypothetical protein PV326_006467 [Microctonus aethiopoides]
MGLLDADLPPIIDVQNSSASRILVFFDLETGGFSKTADILQIAAKHEDSYFSIYVTPTQKIDERASNITGLRIVEGQLQYHGKFVISVTLQNALLQFYNFLGELKKKCVLVAHNCTFDRPRLVQAIQKSLLTQYFRAVIFGFSDSLPIIKNVTKLTGKGENKLEKLAETLKISTSNAHNAANDVAMLEQVIMKLGISNESFFNSTLTWDDAIKRQKFDEELPKALKKLDALKTCTSFATRKKIVAADISYDLILEVYKKNKLMGVMNLLGEDENGNVKVKEDQKLYLKLNVLLI